MATAVVAIIRAAPPAPPHVPRRLPAARSVCLPAPPLATAIAADTAVAADVAVGSLGAVAVAGAAIKQPMTPSQRLPLPDSGWRQVRASVLMHDFSHRLRKIHFRLTDNFSHLTFQFCSDAGRPALPGPAFWLIFHLHEQKRDSTVTLWYQKLHRHRVCLSFSHCEWLGAGAALIGRQGAAPARLFFFRPPFHSLIPFHSHCMYNQYSA